MHAFESLAERKIEEAVSPGDLDDLPGTGKPKNAGFVPSEIKAANKLELIKARVERAYFKKVLRRLR